VVTIHYELFRLEGNEDDLNFEEQLDTLVTSFLENLRGLCVRKNRSFKKTLGEVYENIPALAIRMRTYMPNTWNGALRKRDDRSTGSLRETAKGSVSTMDEGKCPRE